MYTPLNIDIGKPEENPHRIVEPVVDPVPRENPVPVPKEPIKKPKREKVPA